MNQIVSTMEQRYKEFGGYHEIDYELEDRNVQGLCCLVCENNMRGMRNKCADV